MPEPRAQSPEPRAQSPEPRAQSPEPRAQSPERRLWPERRPGAPPLDDPSRAAGVSSLPILSRLPRAVALLAPLLLAAAVLVPTGEARAQTTVTLVSNTGQVAGGSFDITHSLAQGFRTGGKIAGYNLASVGFALGALGTDPNVANTATVTLRKSTSGSPGDVVYTFTSPTLAANSVNTFTAPDGAVLSANTDYFLVVQETAGAVPDHDVRFYRTDLESKVSQGLWAGPQCNIAIDSSLKARRLHCDCVEPGLQGELILAERVRYLRRGHPGGVIDRHNCCTGNYGSGDVGHGSTQCGIPLGKSAGG